MVDRIPPQPPAADAAAIWAAARALARAAGREPPERVGVDFPGGAGLVLVAHPGGDRVVAWTSPLPRPAGSLWVFEGKWVCYAGAGEPFELRGQHRQLLEVLAAGGGRAVADDDALRKTTIPSADRLRKVASELRDTLRHRLGLAGDPVARDGGGYRLTVT